jgi:pentatricopeptide repeat protein
MKRQVQSKSSLLAKYTLQYQKKTKSRVFAPLAETYRKLGMIDESLKVLRDGIKNHPTYTLGYIVLAHVYYDQENYEISYNTIRPFVSDNLENITLQKLFAKICINLGYLEEALQTFKCLLLINPKDTYVAEQVKLLEDDLLIEEDEVKVNNNEYIEKRMNSFDSEEDDWVQVSFNKEDRRESRSEPDEGSDWEVSSGLNPLKSFKDDIKTGNLSVEEHDLDDNYYHEEHDNKSEKVIDEKVNNDPIITHTLVNLYCKQGHLDKAIELLDSIIELHPNDSASIRKRDELVRNINNGKESLELKSIQSELAKNTVDYEVQEDENSEQESHLKLQTLIDDKKNNDNELLKKVEIKLNDFLEAIKIESTRKQLSL